MINMKVRNMKMNSIELFAGAGGLALGLEEAGFNHLGLVEFNKAAADTLKIAILDLSVVKIQISQDEFCISLAVITRVSALIWANGWYSRPTF